jgi:hypothetical protein
MAVKAIYAAVGFLFRPLMDEIGIAIWLQTWD